MYTARRNDLENLPHTANAWETLFADFVKAEKAAKTAQAKASLGCNEARGWTMLRGKMLRSWYRLNAWCVRHGESNPVECPKH